MSDILKMFGTVVKSLFKKSTCDRYPFQKPTVFEQTKGHVQIDAPRCILCSMCEKRCPTNAIKVNRNGRTWDINHYQCIFCYNCITVCPTKCLMMGQQYAAPTLTKQHEVVEIPVPVKVEKTEA